MSCESIMCEGNLSPAWEWQAPPLTVKCKYREVVRESCSCTWKKDIYIFKLVSKSFQLFLTACCVGSTSHIFSFALYFIFCFFSLFLYFHSLPLLVSLTLCLIFSLEIERLCQVCFQSLFLDFFFCFVSSALLLSGQDPFLPSSLSLFHLVLSLRGCFMLCSHLRFNRKTRTTPFLLTLSPNFKYGQSGVSARPLHALSLFYPLSLILNIIS